MDGSPLARVCLIHLQLLFGAAMYPTKPTPHIVPAAQA